MFNPSKIVGATAEKYYTHLNETDGYYTKAEEPQGRWLGRGAEALGLPVLVDATTFKDVLNGRLNRRELVANADKEGRVKGFDGPVASPKSVSAAYAVGNDDVRAAIMRAQDAAVRRTVEKIESIVETRSAKGGKNREAGARLVVGAFTHETNRANEPSLHSHLVAMNVAVRGDGSTATPNFRPMLQRQKEIGAFYRHEMARALQREGFAVRAVVVVDENGRNFQSFELRDVPEKLVDAFSERAREIQEEAARTGEKKNIVNRRTRASKETISRAELDERWAAAAKEAGIEGRIDFRQPGERQDGAELEKLRVAGLPKAERDEYYKRLAAENEKLDAARAPRRDRARGAEDRAPAVSKEAVAGMARGFAAILAAAAKAKSAGKTASARQVDGIERALERRFEAEE